MTTVFSTLSTNPKPRHHIGDSSDYDYENLGFAAMIRVVTVFLMPDPVRHQVSGYHGTSNQAANRIVATQEFRSSVDSGDWLGNGVYFFEESEESAWNWARRRFPQAPAVVKASIYLGYCIDVTASYFKKELQKVRKLVEQEYYKRQHQMPANVGHNWELDCAVLNRACELSEPKADTIRAIISRGVGIYDGSSILSDSHIQLCVRNPKCIMYPEQIYSEHTYEERL